MIMMTRSRSKKNAWVKTLFALPVLAVMMLAFAGSPAGEFQDEPMTFRGSVIDAETGSPLSAVLVVVQGTPTITTTDGEGNYSLTLEKKDPALVFSYVGYKTVEARGTTSGRIDIELEREIYKLDPYVQGSETPSSGDTHSSWEDQLKARLETYDPTKIIWEEKAYFPGGLPALKDYLEGNIRYPEHASEGTSEVAVKFMIETDGSVRDARIIRAVSPEMDREALRLVSSMPDWRPAVQMGQIIRSNYILPVVFQKQF
jgi:TonB family protein